MSRYNIQLTSNSNTSKVASMEIYVLSTGVFFAAAYLASLIF